MEKLFDVTFNGNIIKGNNQEKVKKNISSIFKIDINKIDVVLLSGKPLIVKSSITENEAVQAKEILKKAGALCEIVPAQKKEAKLDAKNRKVNQKNEENKLVITLVVITVIMVLFFTLLSTQSDILKQSFSNQKKRKTTLEQKTRDKEKVVAQYDSPDNSNNENKDKQDSNSEQSNIDMNPQKQFDNLPTPSGEPKITGNSTAADKKYNYINFVKNSNFNSLINWQVYKSSKIKGYSYIKNIEDYVQWERINSKNNDATLGVYQDLNRDVKGAEKLIIEFDVIVEYHSLSNTGVLADIRLGSGKAPVQVMLTYIDESGKEQNWVHNFLINHDERTKLSNFTIVKKEKWHHFYANLMDDRVRVTPMGWPMPKPVKLVRITARGIGWDYKGAIGNLFIKKSIGKIVN